MIPRFINGLGVKLGKITIDGELRDRWFICDVEGRQVGSNSWLDYRDAIQVWVSILMYMDGWLEAPNDRHKRGKDLKRVMNEVEKSIEDELRARGKALVKEWRNIR